MNSTNSKGLKARESAESAIELQLKNVVVLGEKEGNVAIMDSFDKVEEAETFIGIEGLQVESEGVSYHTFVRTGSEAALAPDVKFIPGEMVEGVYRLPQVWMLNKWFFVDERLKQYRNVNNPHEFYDEAEMDTLLEVREELDARGSVDTPEVRELLAQWKALYKGWEYRYKVTYYKEVYVEGHEPMTDDEVLQCAQFTEPKAQVKEKVERVS